MTRQGDKGSRDLLPKAIPPHFLHIHLHRHLLFFRHKAKKMGETSETHPLGIQAYRQSVPVYIGDMLRRGRAFSGCLLHSCIHPLQCLLTHPPHSYENCIHKKFHKSSAVSLALFDFDSLYFTQHCTQQKYRSGCWGNGSDKVLKCIHCIGGSEMQGFNTSSQSLRLA